MSIYDDFIISSYAAPIWPLLCLFTYTHTKFISFYAYLDIARRPACSRPPCYVRLYTGYSHAGDFQDPHCAGCSAASYGCLPYILVALRRQAYFIRGK